MSTFSTLISSLKTDIDSALSLPVFLSTTEDIKNPPSGGYVNIVVGSTSIDPRLSQNSGILWLNRELSVVLVNFAGQDINERIDKDIIAFSNNMETLLSTLHLWCNTNLIQPATLSGMSVIDRPMENFIRASCKMTIYYEI